MGTSRARTRNTPSPSRRGIWTLQTRWTAGLAKNRSTEIGLSKGNPCLGWRDVAHAALLHRGHAVHQLGARRGLPRNVDGNLEGPRSTHDRGKRSNAWAPTTSGARVAEERVGVAQDCLLEVPRVVQRVCDALTECEEAFLLWAGDVPRPVHGWHGLSEYMEKLTILQSPRIPFRREERTGKDKVGRILDLKYIEKERHVKPAVSAARCDATRRPRSHAVAVPCLDS